MSKVVSHRQSMIALMLAFALCLSASLMTLRYPRSYLSPANQSDFKVYFIASNLVRGHLDAHLYDDAGTGVDPQLRFASDGSVIARMAHSKGIKRIQLYVYPAFLADVLLPLTLLSVSKAFWVWRFFNLLGVVVSAAFISRLLGLRLRSTPSLLVLMGLFCFSPLWQALFYGQITIMLLVLWSAGFLLYAQGWKRTSALVLSVAALVKIAPLLIVLPILIWRDWRWIRWYAGGILAGFLLMCLKNSPGTVLFYFLRVIPPMSTGVVDRQNKTVLAAIGMLWCHGLNYRGMVVPPHVVLIGKLLCAVLVGTAVLLVYESSRGLQKNGRVFVLAAFALLSLCVSPVSWVDALVVGYILLALLWNRMLAGGRRHSELLLLFATTVTTGVSVAIGSDSRRIDSFFFFQYAPLILSLLLVFFVLRRGVELSSKDAAV